VGRTPASCEFYVSWPSGSERPRRDVAERAVAVAERASGTFRDARTAKLRDSRGANSGTAPEGYGPARERAWECGSVRTARAAGSKGDADDLGVKERRQYRSVCSATLVSRHSLKSPPSRHADLKIFGPVSQGRYCSRPYQTSPA